MIDKQWLKTALIGSLAAFIAFGGLWYTINPNAVLDTLNHLSGPLAAKFLITCLTQGAIIATVMKVD